MATSTERTVREALVAAIRGIALDLGFDEPNGNVKDYPGDMHAGSTSTYVMAKVDGAQKARCWAVDVRARDVPHAMNNVWKRLYLIRVLAYYERGQNGEGYLALIDDARRVRGAIRGLTSNLGATVDLVTEASELRIEEAEGPASERLLIGEMTYEAERVNPDF